MKLLDRLPFPGLCRCACRTNHGVRVPVCTNVPDRGEVCQPCEAWTTALSEETQP